MGFTVSVHLLVGHECCPVRELARNLAGASQVAEDPRESREHFSFFIFTLKVLFLWLPKVIFWSVCDCSFVAAESNLVSAESICFWSRGVRKGELAFSGPRGECPQKKPRKVCLFFTKEAKAATLKPFQQQ